MKSNKINSYVVDTMALVLFLEKRKLPSHIKNIFLDAIQSKIVLYIPSIVCIEVAYLSEKNRIETNLNDINKLLSNNIKLIAINMNIIQKTFEIDDIKELHDRLIAGTAYYKKLQLVTNDPVIESSKFVKTVWD